MEKSDRAPAHAQSSNSGEPPTISVLGKGDEPEAVNIGCGWGRFRPAILAPLANVWTFVVLYIVFAFTHGVNGAYGNPVLTTLERRFNLSSSLAGFITNLSVLGYVLSVLFVSFFFAKKDKPRIFAVCMLITSIGAFLYLLPHIVYGTGNDAIDAAYAQRHTVVNKTTESGSVAVQLCALGGSVGAKSECNATERQTPGESLSIVTPAALMISAGEIFQGLAGAPVYTLGLAFIDDHTGPALSAKLIGLMYTVRLIAPVVAFAMGGSFLAIYANLKATDLTPKNPRWIGAWWLGFVIACIINAIIFIPTSMLPGKLRPIKKSSSSTAATPDKGKKDAEEEKEMKNINVTEDREKKEENERQHEDKQVEGKEQKKKEIEEEIKKEEKRETEIKEEDEEGEREEGNEKEKERTEQEDKKVEGEEKKEKEEENKQKEGQKKKSVEKKERVVKEKKKKENEDETKEDKKVNGEEKEADKVKEGKKMEHKEMSVVSSTTGQESSSVPNKSTDSSSVDWKEFPKALLRLLRNPIYMLAMIAMCIDFTAMGLMAFMPKYFEVHFQKTASVANLLGGMIPALFAAVASYVGGVVSGKIKGIDGGVAGLCRMNSILSLITLLLLVPAILLSCPDVPYSGQVVNHRLNLTTDCNLNCGCSSNAFDPVCGSDGLLYFSPCHAGCTQQANSTTNPSDPSGRLVRSAECSCVAEVERRNKDEEDGVVYAGVCDNSCVSLIPYIVILILVYISNNLYHSSDITILLRVNRKEDKSIALGLQIFCLGIAYFPAPSMYGLVFDMSCILKKTVSCSDSEGTCLLYDRRALRLGFNGLAITLKVIATALYFISYFLARSRRLLLEAQERDLPKLAESSAA